MHRSRIPGALRATLFTAIVAGFGISTSTQAAPPANAAAASRVIVSFKPGAANAARAAIAAAGGQVVVDLSEVNALAARVPAAALAGLRRNPSVEFVEDDPLRRIAGHRSSAGTGSVALLPGTTQQAPYGIAMVEADQVPDDTAGSRKLCIVDSGIDAAHEDLGGLALGGINLTRSGQWFTDENSHGTHVAGTIAAVANAIGVVGVLPHQRLNLFIAKVFDASGSAPSSTISRAMLECQKAGANVVSMSLGGGGSLTEQRTADRLAAANILVVAAAGNDGDSSVSYPAGYASVVSVAAVDSKRKVASFSQFNADVELAAPGVGVLSTVPLGSQVIGAVTVGTSTYAAVPMEGSPRTSASGALADFGLGDKPVAGSMAGKICLISRGTITFAEKVVNCQNSGGLGAVVYNNTSGELDGTLGETVTSIPSVGTTQADGASMLKQLGQATTVAVSVTNDVYAYYDGTSMATPHVSGVAALVWSHFPHCTASEIRNSLDLHATDLGTRGRDAYYGFGLVQAKATYDAIATGGCGR